MTDGGGACAVGSWFGTGPDRGMALVFMVAGVIGLVVTLLAMRTRSYRNLSAQFAGSGPATGPDRSARSRRRRIAAGSSTLRSIIMSNPTSEAMSRAGKGTGGESEVGRSRPLPYSNTITWGVPVVCSDGSLPTDVVHEYRLGTLFEAGDADSLARAVPHWCPQRSTRTTLPIQHRRGSSNRVFVAEQALHALGTLASTRRSEHDSLSSGARISRTVSSAVCADVSSQSPRSAGVPARSASLSAAV